MLLPNKELVTKYLLFTVDSIWMTEKNKQLWMTSVCCLDKSNGNKITENEGLAIACANSKVGTDAERIVSVRPRKNFLVEAVSYAGAMWPCNLNETFNNQQQSTNKFATQTSVTICFDFKTIDRMQ